MFDREDNEEREVKKRRKPRQQAEILDTPRRWLVRGLNNYVSITETKPQQSQSTLMGTHEDQRHAEKRLGW